MNYWDNHGIVFLICIAIFPRLTLFFATIMSFGLFGWLGFIFAPHILVAILATNYYWDTNPILCVIAWVIALGGSSGEAKVAKKGINKISNNSL